MAERLEEAMKRLEDREDEEGDFYYDLRYAGGWVELVRDAMAEIDPSKDWTDDVSRVLEEEVAAGRLDRNENSVDWDAVEKRIRGT